MSKSSSFTHIQCSITSVLCLLNIYLGATNCNENNAEGIIKRVSRSLLQNNNVLNYEVQEESPRGTLVGDIGQDILKLLSNSVHDGNLGSVKFDLTITNWRDRAVQLFLLDTTTGQLRIASPPDRETICPATGLANSQFALNYPQSEIESLENEVYSNEDTILIRGHVTANTPCYVDLKIAYTMRETKKSPPLAADKNEVDQQTAGSDPGLLIVRIKVLDINDHAPVFPQSRLTSELGEISAQPEKTAVDLPTAFDPDAGENGTISYWIAERSMTNSPTTGHAFDTIQQKSGETDNGIPFRLAGDPLRLILTKHLDWETKREYDLIMYAKDYGKPQSLTGQLSIHVSVRDENDNVPRFSQTTYTAVINESVLRGSVIMELSASDADSTNNGQLTFSLAPPTDSQERLALQYFGIRTVSSNQAAIYVIQTPDVDATPKTTFSDQTVANFDKFSSLPEGVGKQYSFHAIVRDNGYPRQLSSRTEVTVLVLDVNDMPPNIVVSYLNPSTQATDRLDFGRSPLNTDRTHGQVKENSNRAFIAFVSVQDFDAGEWGHVRCFTNNDAFELLPVNEATRVGGDSFGQYDGTHRTMSTRDSGVGETGFKLLAVKPFDREQVSEVSFHIICVDNPQYSGSTSINYLKQSNPYLSLSQLPYGSSSSGTGSLQLTGTALVRVFVTDENDNSPLFSRSQYSFILDEVDGSTGRTIESTLETQMFVGRVSATDQDSTSQISYYLVPELRTQFRIERETGKIYALQQFDREEIVEKIKQSEYPQTDAMRAELEAEKSVYLHFNVIATDGVHNSTAKVRVLIRDVNDNAPIFTKSHYEFTVPENEQPIQSGSIGTVEAYDLDADRNAQIVYQIFDITDASTEKADNQTSRSTRYATNMLFTISAKSGHLHLIRTLDREKQSHHIFYILAVDNPREGHVDRSWQKPSNTLDTITVSLKSHTATATVTVIVADVNDNAPTITYPTPHGVINVESGAPAGHNLFTVVAHDPDAGENGTIRYTLSMANFERINSHTNSKDSILVGDGGASVNFEDVGGRDAAVVKSGLFSIDATTGIVFSGEKITDQSANYLLVIGAHDLGRPHQRKTTTTVTVRAHNSQLVNAFNNHRPGGRHSITSDIRQSKGSIPISDAVNIDTGPGQGGSASRASSHNLRTPTGLDAPVEDDFESAYHNVAGGSVRVRFASITDRTVVVILATIFALLLMTTIVLVLLIKRRRDAENHRSAIHKSSYDCSSSNNIVRLDQPFIRAKLTSTGRPDTTGSENGTCTMNSTGSKPSELPTLPRLHPIILHEGQMNREEIEHLEYGSSIYGKGNVYPGEAITMIPSSNNNDYQQAIPVCIFDRSKQDWNLRASEQTYSNAVLASSRSGTSMVDNVTLGRKTNDQASHQMRALCSSAEMDYYQRQGLLSNFRKPENNKRYETIDPLIGTLKMKHEQARPNVNTSCCTMDASHTEVSPSTLKRTELRRVPTDQCGGDGVGTADLNHGSIQESTFSSNSQVSCALDTCSSLERNPAPSDLDDLAIQLHRIKRADELGWIGAATSATVCENGAVQSGTNANHVSRNPSSSNPNCDHHHHQHHHHHQIVRRTDGCSNNKNNISDANTTDQFSENFKSAQQTSKGVSFV